MEFRLRNNDGQFASVRMVRISGPRSHFGGSWAEQRDLVRLRTELTRGTARRRAHRLSGAVQCRSEGEYPLVGIRRDRLRMARDELVTLLDER